MNAYLRWNAVLGIMGGGVFPLALLLHPVHATASLYTGMHILLGIADGLLFILLLGVSI